MTEDAITAIEVYSDTSTLNSNDLTDFLFNLRNIASRKRLDFDQSNALSDTDYYNSTGLRYEECDTFAECVRDEIRS